MLFHLCALALLLTITTASLLASLIEPSVSHVRRQAAPLCSQYAYHAANGYEFNNNDWGRGSATSGSQCTTVDSTSSSGVKWPTTWNWQGGQNNLKSYANVGKQFSKGLIVGNIKSMLPRIQWDYQPRDGSSVDYELMVWLARIGCVYPIGNKVTTVNLAGFNWDLYVGPNGSMKVFSFIPADGSWKFSFNADIKVFLLPI
ncbi:cellulase [Ascochyta rabiei]|uniref:Cellulase n=1 Tax=Didymella rabiei TaxID=5454 RepID=A0A163AQ86_DIDRA|nr:cellulase [Ascochyta rabiei]